MEREDLAVDVLIVGAGASGAAFSWSLAESGISVLCLEQGDWVQNDSYSSTHDDWELHRQTDMNPNPNVRRDEQDYPIDEKDSEISPLMYNAVGGSTIHWSAHVPRFHPSDFRVRTLDGVADDWPIKYEDLEEFYDLNDQMIGVAGAVGDPAYPPKPARQTWPVPLGKVGLKMVEGFERLGWHWWPSESAIVTEPYDGRLPCNNCGPCDIGCTRGSKASSDITYWPKALKAGAKLKTGVTVSEITLDADGLANGVLYYRSDGSAHRQRAGFVILAANGIGTTRLLLNSKSTLFPNGLANKSGLVGRNLMFHPYTRITGIFDEALDGHKGPISCCLISHEFYETDPSRDFLRGYSLQVVRGSGPVQSALGGLARNMVPWGSGHRTVFKERYNHEITLAISGEDLPEKENRVELDASLTDKFGIPAPKVIYRLSDNSKKLMDHAISKGTEALKAAGAKYVLTHPLLRASGWHLLGTARMGSSPETSVVNQWGQSHDVDNLFIIDGSIFVTSAAIAPTSTIQALALRIADYFKRNFKSIL